MPHHIQLVANAVRRLHRPHKVLPRQLPDAAAQLQLEQAVLEIAEITDRVSKWGPRGRHGPGGPALLFENVRGYPGAKLLINQFGSERRMRLALDVDSLDRK